MSKLQRVIKLVLLIWLCSALCALPLALQFGIKYEWLQTAENESIQQITLCTLKRPIQYSFELSTLVFFAIPLCLLTVLYIQIGLHLRRSEHAIVRQLTATNLHSPALVSALNSTNTVPHGLLNSPSGIHLSTIESNSNLVEQTIGLLSADIVTANHSNKHSPNVACNGNGSIQNTVKKDNVSPGSSSLFEPAVDKKASFCSQSSGGSITARIRSWKFFEQRSNSVRTMGNSSNSRRAVIKMLGK